MLCGARFIPPTRFGVGRTRLVGDHGTAERQGYQIGGRAFSLKATSAQASVVLHISSSAHGYLHYVTNRAVADRAPAAAKCAKVQFGMMFYRFALPHLGIQVLAAEKHVEVLVD